MNRKEREALYLAIVLQLGPRPNTSSYRIFRWYGEVRISLGLPPWPENREVMNDFIGWYDDELSNLKKEKDHEESNINVSCDRFHRGVRNRI